MVKLITTHMEQNNTVYHGTREERFRESECSHALNIVVLDGFTATGHSCETPQSSGGQGGDGAWQALAALGRLTVWDRTAAAQTVARAKDADIVLTNKVVIGRETMDALPRLRYIGVLATGYNVVDVGAARERGIIVTNVPAYSTESVAQMVFAHLLAVANRTEHYARANREGRWSNSPDFCYWDFPHMELAGKSMGIVGLGNIGCRVAAIAQAFGMRVAALTSKRACELPPGMEKASKEELLRTSDVLTLHCPLTPATFHFIDDEALRLMRPQAILINTGRGPLVDETAVAAALHEGRLAAFCADVLAAEPPPADLPLLKEGRAFVTPHIAWATTEARQRLIEVATDNVRAFLSGAPRNVVGG